MAAEQRLLALLLVTAVLALSFSQGMVEARKVRVMRAVRHDGRRAPGLRGRLLPEEMVYTLMDYGPPTANTNTRGGMNPSPDPPSPPTH
ncbi:hypothetical protein SEVIR_2G211200v4 [Setaria viridis]|uniref:Uncharacterized protein n=2 Tax=Setaria TaxID=4554 RepID=K4A4B0_SETIT|nr:uncharacterized protein LOC101772764 [Setaria italica]XP_034579366.1 uncharacterized protein LOC117842947 [Setaria viridis]RCV11641.1 hypothetical protein SETIT_2G203000v2 [Setaria italica]RCV11642.1 hypothetical protein SETIT_2G203000v2 [Setaria italica]TKW33096.1 hypothetical protein SEVIR_2G211200v2 [Setaria viridis]TKW33097.1 hypothetical protein SEVIR_2G211200v2 [Setaria viridis]